MNRFRFTEGTWTMLAIVALVICNSCLLTGEGIINEIHYHPASDDDREEFIELFNPSATALDIGGWSFSNGIKYTFQSGATIPPNDHVVIVSSPEVFAAKHPEVNKQHIYGPWEGRLNNRGETISLLDAQEKLRDRVIYANEGEFARRTWSTDFRQVRGLQWLAPHDGGGPSLELRQWNLSNMLGANWASSQLDSGSPGRSNTQVSSNVPPIISKALHSPPLPRSDQQVNINFEVNDESLSGVQVSLYFSINEQPFNSVPLTPITTSNDIQGIYQAIIPQQNNHAVVEFYIQAQDALGASSSWPRPTLPDNEQDANAMYQVDDRPRIHESPEYRIIMPPSERQRFLDVVSPRTTNANGQTVSNQKIYSNGNFHATFISHFDGQYRIRYQTEVRNRGNGSRQKSPNNFRIDFASDALWRQAEKLNLNAQFPWLQALGAAISRQVGLLAAPSRLVRVYMNETLRAQNSFPTYEMYAANDVMNSDFAARQGLGNANIYRGIRKSGTEEADLRYLGDDPEPYRRVYFKETNKTEGDWTDLLALTRAFTESSDEQFEQEISRWIDVPQWIRFLAADTFYANQETALGNGFGDDYYFYRSEKDGLFRLIPYDQDTIFGQGDTGANPNEELWKATRGPATKRLLTWPNFAPLYYSNLVQLAEGPLSEAEFKPFFKRILSTINVPEPRKEQLLAFAKDRGNFILETIPRRLAANIPLPEANGIFLAESAIESLPFLSGTSDATRTAMVTVNGMNAHWNPVTATWALVSAPLKEGINRFNIQATGPNETVIEKLTIDVYLPIKSSTPLTSNFIEGDTHWTIDQSPIVITDTVILNQGSVLTIDPNVHLRFTPTGRLTLRGQMRAVGAPDQPILFSADTGAFWGGIALEPGAELHLDHVIIERATGNAVSVDKATLTALNTTWRQLPGRAINANGASVTLEDCHFQYIETNTLITINDENQAGETTISGSVFNGNSSEHPVIEIIDNATNSTPILIQDNRFNLRTGSALRLLDAKAIVNGNRFSHENAADAQTSIAIEIKNSNPTRPLRFDLARNIFHQISQGIEASGSIHLNVHNNTFESIEDTVLTLQEGVINAEWINNLHRSVNQGYRIVNEEESTIELETHGNLSDTQINIDTTLIPIPFMRLGSDGSLSPGSPASGTGHGGLDIGATAKSFPNLSYLENLPWHLFGASIPLWAPGVERFEIARLPQETDITVTVVQNGGTWKPQSIESLAQAYQVAAVSQGGRLITTQNVVLNFDSSTPTVQLAELGASRASTETLALNFVEIQNRVDRPIDLSGYALSDDPLNLRKYVFPQGTVLPPNGRLVAEGAEAPKGTLTLPFRFDPDGEAAFLSDPFSRVIDSIRYGRQIPNASIAKTIQNEWRLAIPSPGTANQFRFIADPREIQLSEYLTQPTSQSATGEFIEIKNPSPLPVSLDGVFLSNTPEVDPLKLGFPPLSFIDAQSQHLLVESTQAGRPRLNFGLSSQPSAIGLAIENGSSIDIISYGLQFAGHSEARNANNEIVSLPTPTPGLPNTPSIGRTSTLDIALIDSSHSWRFDQTGRDLGIDWRKPDFDDKNWQEGVGVHAAGKALLPEEPQTELDLGITTYYFRSEFDYDILIPPLNAVLHLIADDGAIVYINDQEVAKVRMPNITPNYLTQASELIDSDWEGPFPLDPSLFRAGRNLMAVEVHQSTPNSNDVAFALSLDITVDSGSIDDVVLSEAVADNRSTTPEGMINETDWIELFNRSLFPVDLSFAKLSDSLTRKNSWSFPPDTYIPGFGRHIIQFNPNSPSSADNTGFGLKASGDSLYLIEERNSAIRIIDSVTFGLQVPNLSLARIGPEERWGAAIPTPGSDNLAASLGDVSQIRVNEWLARSNQGPDWFEIYNPENQPVDLSGIFLSDDFLSPFKQPLPNLSYLGAGQDAWRQFIADNKPEDGADHVAFKLGANGDNIAVFSADGMIIDSVTFGAQESDLSEGFLPDGGTNLSSFGSPSPALSNQSFQDTDQDGMEDEWERVNGLDPNNAADATMDPDSDGLTNREEFLLGTNPRSESSGLTIDGFEHIPGQIMITFTAIAGRGYALQERNDLQLTDWRDVWILDQTPQTGIVTAKIESASSQAFYRLILR